MFYKKVVLKTLAIFTGKHLCWILVLVKLESILLKKAQTQVFSFEYGESFKNTYFQIFKNIYFTSANSCFYKSLKSFNLCKVY